MELIEGCVNVIPEWWRIISHPLNIWNIQIAWNQWLFGAEWWRFKREDRKIDLDHLVAVLSTSRLEKQQTIWS